jgi:hypothetical protein
MELKVIKNYLQTNFFIIYGVIFFLFYLIFIQKQTENSFFVISLLIVISIIIWQNLEKTSKTDENMNKFILDIQDELSKEYEIPDKKTYTIHKSPKTLKYLMKKDDFMNLIYDLKFMKIYDKSSYYKLISYINYFLKIHYYVVLEKYDFKLNFPILKDLRNDILNIMKSIHYNIPDISTILDIKNVDIYVQQRTKKMQGLTYKYLKIIYHKFNKSLTYENYNPPFEFDYAKEEHYELF